MSLSVAQKPLAPIDISGLKAGNVGVDYAHRFDAARPGPVVMATALVHGNELCGAHALARLFDSDFRPESGSLICCFCNVAAYHAFDPMQPVRSRFLDEDFNRVWDRNVLEGDRRSRELERAREILPLLEAADVLLDLHSMQTAGAPLMLSGMTPRAQSLARRVGYPGVIVADVGHAAGRRMRDYGKFGAARGKAVALLAECGQHFDPAAATHATEILARFLLATGIVTRAQAERLSEMPRREAPRLIEGTGRVTVKTDEFRFCGEPMALDVIAKSGSVIAVDGGEPVRTPHDDCVLIMPSRRLTRGQTAVRFGRYVA